MATATKQKSSSELGRESAALIAFNTGHADYRKGVGFASNPYIPSFLRSAWDRGWLDAQRGEAIHRDELNSPDITA
jgi:hypothetical protein